MNKVQEMKTYKYKRTKTLKDGTSKDYYCSQQQIYKGNELSGRPMYSFTINELEKLKNIFLKNKKNFKKTSEESNISYYILSKIFCK